MVVFNTSGSEVNAKIVYYGPALSGKTTNLEHIYGQMPSDVKGKMVSMKTRTDRTLFFDFLPLQLGDVNGYRTRLLLYTVPGQVYYNATRKLVLKGADAVVFVADSDPEKHEENIDSLRNLEENLNELGLTLDTTPWVIQFNKRDLPNATPVRTLESELNLLDVPSFEAVATQGIGVYETFQGIAGMLYNKLTEKLEPREPQTVSAQPSPPITPGADAPVSPTAQHAKVPVPSAAPDAKSPVPSPVPDAKAPAPPAAEHAKAPVPPAAQHAKAPVPSAAQHAKAPVPSAAPAAASEGGDKSVADVVDDALREVSIPESAPIRVTAESAAAGDTNVAEPPPVQAPAPKPDMPPAAQPISKPVSRPENAPVAVPERTETAPPTAVDGEDETFQFANLEAKEMDETVGQVLDLDEPESGELKVSDPQSDEFITDPCRSDSSPDDLSEMISPAEDVTLAEKSASMDDECVITVPVLLSRTQIRKTIPIKLRLEVQVVDDEL